MKARPNVTFYLQVKGYVYLQVKRNENVTVLLRPHGTMLSAQVLLSSAYIAMEEVLLWSVLTCCVVKEKKIGRGEGSGGGEGSGDGRGESTGGGRGYRTSTIMIVRVAALLRHKMKRKTAGKTE